MICEIIAELVEPTIPYGISACKFVCRTHNFTLPDTSMGKHTLCPLGRIEQATEQSVGENKAGDEMTHQALQNGDHIFSCDGCPDEVEFDKLDLAQATQKLNKYGWKIISTNNGRRHYCDKCVLEGLANG